MISPFFGANTQSAHIVAKRPDEGPVVAKRPREPTQATDFVPEVGPPRISEDGGGERVEPNVERHALGTVGADADSDEQRLLAQPLCRLYPRLHEQAAPVLGCCFGNAHTGPSAEQNQEDAVEETVLHNGPAITGAGHASNQPKR